MRLGCNQLPAELLGRIFSHLPDDERCDSIPVVSRAFLHAHRACPPLRTYWEVHAQHGGFTRGMETWLLAIVPNLESLTLDAEKTSCMGIDIGRLPQMLIGAMHAQKLRELHIGYAKFGWSQVFASLSLLGQVKVLHINNWWFHEAGGMEEEINGLSGLVSLEELSLFELEWSRLQVSQAECLWTALQATKSLRALTLQVMVFEDWHLGLDPFLYLNSVSKLTQIRSLDLELMSNDWAFNNSHAASIGILVQLTSLKIVAIIGDSRTLNPVLALPALENLHISLCGSIWHPQPVSLAWKSKSLTSLTFDLREFYIGRDERQFQVEDFIPMEAALLARLCSLGLGKWTILGNFSEPFAAALASLLVLKIHNCSLPCLPPAIAKIRTLNELSMEGMLLLQLQAEDVDTLAALPDLRIFRWIDERWPQLLLAAYGYAILRGQGEANLEMYMPLMPMLTISHPSW